MDAVLAGFGGALVGAVASALLGARQARADGRRDAEVRYHDELRQAQIDIAFLQGRTTEREDS